MLSPFENQGACMSRTLVGFDVVLHVLVILGSCGHFWGLGGRGLSRVVMDADGGADEGGGKCGLGVRRRKIDDI